MHELTRLRHDVMPSCYIYEHYVNGSEKQVRGVAVYLLHLVSIQWKLQMQIGGLCYPGIPLM